MFDCTCNTQNSLLLNQHNGDDAPQDLCTTLRFGSVLCCGVLQWRCFDITLQGCTNPGWLNIVSLRLTFIGLQYGTLCAGVQFPVGAREPLNLLLGGYRVLFRGVKWSGRDVEYSLPSRAEFKNRWSYISPPVYIHGAYRDNFTFLYQYILALYCPSVTYNFDVASYCLENFGAFCM